jgi:hypothetical protein
MVSVLGVKRWECVDGWARGGGWRRGRGGIVDGWRDKGGFHFNSSTARIPRIERCL